jgi:hypothetical protein
MLFEITTEFYLKKFCFLYNITPPPFTWQSLIYDLCQNLEKSQCSGILDPSFFHHTLYIKTKTDVVHSADTTPRKLLIFFFSKIRQKVPRKQKTSIQLCSSKIPDNSIASVR